MGQRPMLTLAAPWRIRGGRSRSMCARSGEKRATLDSAPARPMIEGRQLPPPVPSKQQGVSSFSGVSGIPDSRLILVNALSAV